MNQIKTVGELFTIGRRIEYVGNMANPRGLGAVVSVTPGDQWGGPYVDVALADGRYLRRIDVRHLVPETERRGCANPYLVLEGYADTMELAELVAAVAIRKANEEAKKKAAADAFTAEVERLKVAHPDLEVGTTAKVAAANCRKLLKAAFPGVKFSVRSGRATYSATLDVRWTDGPTTAQVDEIADRFKAGYFDGMDDCYKSQRSPWGDTFGSAEYVSTRREYSDALIAGAIAALVEKYGSTDVPTVEEYRHGKAWGRSPIINASSRDDWQGLIGRQCSEMEG